MYLGHIGHCCCYIQHSMELCNSLPRCKSEVVQVIKKFKSLEQEGTDTLQEDTQRRTHASFMVRRDKVLQALAWLKRHHTEYMNDDVVINEENLNWMEGKKQENFASIVELQTDDKDNSGQYGSVSTYQTEGSVNNDIEYYGSTEQRSAHGVSKDQIRSLEELKSECKKHKIDIPVLDFPQVGEQPINEYHTQKLFSNIYPWLFPGGEGDIYNDHDGNCIENGKGWIWANRMMNWSDGRFMKDKTFCFYALDMIQRHENNNNGKFFIKSMLHEDIPTLEDLKQKVQNHDTAFIPKIQNFASRVKGSDPFWRAKKPELESWIEHHVEMNHGPPTLFITLSCAEYWWPDLTELIYQQVTRAGNTVHAAKIKSGDFEAICQGVKEYSAIVQQFFVARVSNWLRTFGKDVIHIEHYWCRFEFAKGRGEIHAHMVAITKEGRYINSKMYENRNDKAKCTEILSSYARGTLDLTSTFPGSTDQIPPPEGKGKKSEFQSSLKRRCSDIGQDNNLTLDTDLCQLCCATQIHKCSNYCMHYKRQKRKR